jgi:hypothetical protein
MRDESEREVKVPPAGFNHGHAINKCTGVRNLPEMWASAEPGQARGDPSSADWP